ncbi:hypothetical protein GCM10028773_29570 [Spirosoma koreense]
MPLLPAIIADKGTGDKEDGFGTNRFHDVNELVKLDSGFNHVQETTELPTKCRTKPVRPVRKAPARHLKVGLGIGKGVYEAK